MKRKDPPPKDNGCLALWQKMSTCAEKYLQYGRGEEQDGGLLTGTTSPSLYKSEIKLHVCSCMERWASQ